MSSWSSGGNSSGSWMHFRVFATKSFPAWPKRCGATAEVGFRPSGYMESMSYDPTRPVMQEERVAQPPPRVVEQPVIHRHTRRVSWSPAQVVALIVGLFYGIIGAVALLRTGIHTDGQDALLHPRVSVGGFHHTPLLAMIEVGFGLLCILAGAIPGGGRTTMTFLGTVALGLGIIIVIQPSSFFHLFAIR